MSKPHTQVFHDYEWFCRVVVNHQGKTERVTDLYILMGLPKGCICRIYHFESEERWQMQTESFGGGGSVRYSSFKSLQDALDHGIKWARRKDREAAQMKEFGVKSLAQLEWAKKGRK